MKIPCPSRRRYIRSIQGALLSLGAPIGWFLVQALFDPPDSNSPIVYLYMAIGSFLSFTMFGFIIGSREEDSLRLSLMDHITGIFNGRYFNSRLCREFAHSDRTGSPVSLVLLDLDFFKRVNDQFGHQAGDLVLKKVAQTLSSHVRQGDTSARVGGEEFALILPDADGPAAYAIAERIRIALKEQVIGFPDGQSVRVTVSAGAVCRDQFPGITPEKLFEAADNALFKAKESGRDKVVLTG
ncbi:MAG: GGDEF domain-containing protein [Desulfovibrionales bacterium]